MEESESEKRTVNKGDPAAATAASLLIQFQGLPQD